VFKNFIFVYIFIYLFLLFIYFYLLFVYLFFFIYFFFQRCVGDKSRSAFHFECMQRDLGDKRAKSQTFRRVLRRLQKNSLVRKR
jgi:hypothetical protein